MVLSRRYIYCSYDAWFVVGIGASGMATLVIAGGSGYVGLHLLTALGRLWPREEIVYTYNAHPLDLPEQMPGRGFYVDFVTGEGIETLQSVAPHPKVVINCAAMSVPRECELNPEKAMAVNVPRLLLQFMAAVTSDSPPLLIHFSTDQVYEGVKQFYVEADETNPVNVYGKSKVAAEDFIRSTWSNYVILRSSIIYGPQPVIPVLKSLPVQWMDKVLSANEPVEFFNDEYRCPIFIHDLVKVVEMLCSNTIGETKLLQLVLNLGGPDRLSRFEMAEVVAKVRGHDSSSIKSVSTTSVDRLVASPADISMNVDKLVSALGLQLTPFAEGVNQTFI